MGYLCKLAGFHGTTYHNHRSTACYKWSFHANEILVSTNMASQFVRSYCRREYHLQDSVSACDSWCHQDSSRMKVILCTWEGLDGFRCHMPPFTQVLASLMTRYDIDKRSTSLMLIAHRYGRRWMLYMHSSIKDSTICEGKTNLRVGMAFGISFHRRTHLASREALLSLKPSAGNFCHFEGNRHRHTFFPFWYPFWCLRPLMTPHQNHISTTLNLHQRSTLIQLSKDCVPLYNDDIHVMIQNFSTCLTESSPAKGYICVNPKKPKTQIRTGDQRGEWCSAVKMSQQNFAVMKSKHQMDTKRDAIVQFNFQLKVLYTGLCA